jgi:hypothetical protein
MLPWGERELDLRPDLPPVMSGAVESAKPLYDPLGDVLAELCRLLDEEERKLNLRLSSVQTMPFTHSGKLAPQSTLWRGATVRVSLPPCGGGLGWGEQTESKSTPTLSSPIKGEGKKGHDCERLRNGEHGSSNKCDRHSSEPLLS